MSHDIYELVVEEPTARNIDHLASLVAEHDSEVMFLRLVGEVSMLRELLGEWLHEDTDLKEADPFREFPVSIRPLGVSIVSDSDRSRLAASSISDSEPQPVVDGGQVGPDTNPGIRGDELPLREDYVGTDDWLKDSAHYLGVEFDLLAPLAIDLMSHTTAVAKRNNLKLAYQNFLDRENLGEENFIEVKFTWSRTLRYRYLHNGPGRGGAHYLRDIVPWNKVAIRDLAVSTGMTVFAEGDSYLSVGLEREDVEADCQFIDLILTEVWGRSSQDISWIFEVIDGEPVHDWWFD